MSMTTKTTSLQKVLTALNTHGWRFEQATSMVRVPDPDPNAGHMGRFATRRSSVPKIVVEGVKVSAKSEAHSFTVAFTSEGRYLADQTKGQYPFVQNMTLTTMLEQIERHSPAATKARKEALAAQAKERQEREEREVAEAYASACEKVVEVQEALAAELAGLGLTEDQVRSVLVMAQTEGSTFSGLAGAIYDRERTGRGWGRGNTSVNGLYENGVRVG